MKNCKPEPSVSIVLVTYNSAHLISGAARDLCAESDFEVIVVDNDSVDETCQVIRELFPAIKLIENSSNVGFAKAVNKGVLAAHGATVVLINPDAVVSPSTVRGLAESALRDVVGVAAPEIVHPDGFLNISSYGRFPTSWRMFCHYFGLSRLPGNHHYFEGHYFFPRESWAGSKIEVDWATGACLAVRKEVWDRVGGLSERWFMYAEDIDFCYRVKLAGFQVVIHTDLSATHLVGQSSQELDSGRVNSAWITNLYDFYSQSFARNSLDRVVWVLTVSAGLFLRSLIFSAQGLRGDRKFNFLQARKFRSHSSKVLGLLK